MAMNRERFAKRVASIHPDCFGWALSCCDGDTATAEDVLQESYLKVLDGRARYAERSPFKSWLFGVIRVTALEHRRKDRTRMKRRDHLRIVSDEPVVEAPEVGVEDDRRALAGRLRQALSTLAARQREVLHLVFYQEMTIAEAAGVMEVTVGTARTHYERGKKALRVAMAGEPGFDRPESGAR